MTAIAATFVNIRPISGRKVCQLCFEVPAEQADEALKYLGYPRPDDPVWVGIARLVKPPSVGGSPPGTVEPRSEAATQHPVAAPAEQKAKREWRDMPASQRAGLLCNQHEFIQWMHAANAEDAAKKLRSRCEIPSRAVLDTDDIGRAIYEQIEHDYFKRYEPPPRTEMP